MAKALSFMDAAVAANHANFIKKACSWAEADPLFSVKELDGATAIFSGSSTDTFNVLILDIDTERKAFSIIDEARNNFFGENRFAVWSWRDGQLQDLPVDSSVIEENLIMACDLSDLGDKPADRKAMATTAVVEADHMMGVASVLGAVFGENEEGFMVQSVLAGQDHISIEKLAIKYLVSYDSGEAVASGSYILNDNTAGIYDIAVPPKHRKKGLGSQMFDAVLAAAKQAGAKHYTLQASADGADIYERAGFETLGACWSLDIS